MKSLKDGNNHVQTDFAKKHLQTFEKNMMGAKEKSLKRNNQILKDLVPEIFFDTGEEVNKNVKLFQILKPVMVNPYGFANGEHILDLHKKTKQDH